MRLFNILKFLMKLSDDVDDVMFLLHHSATSTLWNSAKNGEQRILTELWLMLGGVATLTLWNSAKNGGGNKFWHHYGWCCVIWPHWHFETLQRMGATDFDRAMANAALSRHIDIVKLCREWRSFWDIHHELKREFFRWIHDRVTPMARHPEHTCQRNDDEDSGYDTVSSIAPLIKVQFHLETQNSRLSSLLLGSL